jgi:uncharacterized lipoprotein YmbA
MTRRPIYAALGAALLGACSSAPPQFYTLMAPPQPLRIASSTLRIEVLPVELPAQVDTQQLVVRTGSGEVVPVQTRRWVAPLDQEIRDALSDALVSELRALDVRDLAGDPQAPTWRIKLGVRRFESAPGAYARIDADWSVRLAGNAEETATETATVCASSQSQAVAPGYTALVEAHQRALQSIAAQIAGAIRSARNGRIQCP